MAIQDRKIHSGALVARKLVQFRPRITGVLNKVTLSVNATPEDFDVSAFSYMIDGKVYHKAAATGLSLTAIHATGIAKWLGVLVYVDRRGNIGTIGNPDTGDQDHATEAAALASLVDLHPAGTCPIGTITLLTGALDWDGNTDAFDEADLAASNLLGYSPDRRLGSFQPGRQFRLSAVRSRAHVVSGVGQVGVVATRAGQNGILTSPRLEVDQRTVAAATVTKLRVGHFDYLIDGVLYHKDPATAIAFTAAHVVALDKWGAILVQIKADGTVSTKVGAATQTTPLTAANAAAAIALLPAPDAGNVALGYVLIEADAGAWTANTDDLVAASDLESVEIYELTQDRLLSTPALALDAAEKEDFKVGAFSYVLDGVRYSKDATSGLDFTAAHVCALDKYLAILVEIDAAKAVSTRVPLVSGRSQTASQGYDTPNEAIAALPPATPGKLASGYILIAADASTWTANTDDMEAGTDVDAATFVSNTVPVNDLFGVVGRDFAANLHTAATLERRQACLGGATGQICALYAGTTGVLTYPEIDIEYRPYPLQGEV